MRLNVRKLDDRIRKLQEIRALAADPELLALLLEFVASDDEALKMAEMPKGVDATKSAAPASADKDESIALVKEAVAETSSSGGGIWGIRRG